MWSDIELARFAEAIVVGTVVDVHVEWDRSIDVAYTLVTLDVTASVKGELVTGRVTLKQLGGEAAGVRLVVPGQATFAVGERVLVFLERRPRDRTFYTVGLWQGKWRVTADVLSGEPLAMRDRPDPGQRGVFGPARDVRRLDGLLRRLAVSGTAAVPTIARDVAAGRYFVRVRGVNAGGLGPASNEVVVTVGAGAPSALPGAPGTLTSTVVGSTVTLTWGAPSSGGSPTTYVIEAGASPGGSNLASFATGNVMTTFTATGVDAGSYYVRVQAGNAAGTGAASNQVLVTVGGSTPITTNLSGTISGRDTDCRDPFSSLAPCRFALFTVSAPGTLTATLTWSESPDLDLSLWQGTTKIASSFGVTQTETISTTISPGDYELHVTYYSGFTAANFLWRVSTPGGTAPALLAPGAPPVPVPVPPPALSCTYAITPTSQPFGADGGNGTVNVQQRESRCVVPNPPWAVISNAGFITNARAGSLSNGQGPAYYFVQPNTGIAARNGTITVAGNIHTVTQSGTNPFQGTRSGSWSGSCAPLFPGRVSGRFTMNIDASGNVSGSFSGSDSGYSRGTIDPSGSFTASGSAGTGFYWTGGFVVNGGGSGSWGGAGCSGG